MRFSVPTDNVGGGVVETFLELGLVNPVTHEVKRDRGHELVVVNLGSVIEVGELVLGVDLDDLGLVLLTFLGQQSRDLVLSIG